MPFETLLQNRTAALPARVPQAPDSLSLTGLTAHLAEQADSLQDAATLQTRHSVLYKLLQHVEPVDFRAEVALESDKEQLKQKHHLVTVVRKVRDLAKLHGYGLCQRNQAVYVYNGAYWERLANEELRLFLREAAEGMGVKQCDARHYVFTENLLAQFLSDGYQAAPEPDTGEVKLNLKNGTLVIGPAEQRLQPFDPADFLTYQLSYEYNPAATAPRFEAFLNRVQPDVDSQHVLAEFLAYVFVPTGTLKLEKALLLVGSGANGKSVFYELVLKMLGAENVCSYSLHSLTDSRAYHRANLADKKLNYVSEINGKFDANAFKQLVSGEPIEARLPYGQPFIMKEYAKFMGNCNELPTDVEQTDAYFRRFLLIHFAVTIPEAERDPQLAATIAATELSGMLNWVLAGLHRLLAQRGFSSCAASRRLVEDFEKQSDSVRLFLDEEGFRPDPERWITHQDLYGQYKSHCFESLATPVGGKNFRKRMERAGFGYFRKSVGWAIRVGRTVPVSDN